jgi:hypothetical protein
VWRKFTPVFPLLAALASMSAYGVEPSYECTQIGRTSIGWNTHKKKYIASADTKVTHPGPGVTLTELTTQQPHIRGLLGAAPLKVATSSPSSLVMLETTSAGTVVVWTLFEKSDDFSPPTTLLVSTKTLYFLGPVSMTETFSCASAAPAGR